MPDDGTPSEPDRSRFGPNVWLLDELYADYLADPESVGPAWREFFEEYRPRRTDGRTQRPTAPSVGAAAADREDADVVPLTGAPALIARRMDESLTVPTATSVRTVPAKLLELNRRLINRHLERVQGGRVSFTHLIGYAIVRALAQFPTMNRSYGVVDGEPAAIRHRHVNLGLAVDVKRADGTRTLLVPTMKGSETLDFAEFRSAYEDLIRRAHTGRLTPDDFADTTVTITNPGVIGTVQSVPRLMPGQAAIFGVGAIGYPAGYQGADPRTLAEFGISKVVTLTSTYDHRVIQGAESGEFLGRVHELLLGE
ncbi:MAG: 2-oxo acid dehydrogenase subunit E2, partial [Actinomycetota bacterium]